MKTPDTILFRAPWLANGSNYCEGPDGKRICTGSMMGRRNEIPEDKETVRHLRLVRVYPIGTQSGTDYDKGGAYWGNLWSAPLFCAMGESDTGRATLWIRAQNRTAAKRAAMETFPGATFYR